MTVRVRGDGPGGAAQPELVCCGVPAARDGDELSLCLPRNIEHLLCWIALFENGLTQELPGTLPEREGQSEGLFELCPYFAGIFSTFGLPLFDFAIGGGSGDEPSVVKVVDRRSDVDRLHSGSESGGNGQDGLQQRPGVRGEVDGDDDGLDGSGFGRGARREQHGRGGGSGERRGDRSEHTGGMGASAGRASDEQRGPGEPDHCLNARDGFAGDDMQDVGSGGGKGVAKTPADGGGCSLNELRTQPVGVVAEAGPGIEQVEVIRRQVANDMGGEQPTAFVEPGEETPETQHIGGDFAAINGGQHGFELGHSEALSQGDAGRNGIARYSTEFRESGCPSPSSSYPTCDSTPAV